MNNSSLSTLHPYFFFCTEKLLWNRKWSLSLVPAKPTKWLLYDEFMKNLLLWEERRVFTVSELSKVEQGAKVWFLFGSQGTWHTKCFYKEKKKKRQIWFWVQLNIMISIWLCRCSCLFRQLPISRESLELIRVTNVLPTEHAILRQCWACPSGPLTPDRCLQSPDWASSTCWWHLWNFLRISFFPLDCNCRHWRIEWKYVLLYFHPQAVHQGNGLEKVRSPFCERFRTWTVHHLTPELYLLQVTFERKTEVETSITEYSTPVPT